MKKKEEDLICSICKTVINKKKEYAKVVHYEHEAKEKSVGHYHIQCFRDRMSGQEQIRNLQWQAQEIMNMARNKLEAA